MSVYLIIPPSEAPVNTARGLVRTSTAVTVCAIGSGGQTAWKHAGPRHAGDFWLAVLRLKGSLSSNAIRICRPDGEAS
eukprot:scaffold30058_cov29-Prasinocladus_malaysianus.AAC.3